MQQTKNAKISKENRYSDRIYIRLQPTDKSRILEHAKKAGLSLSEYMRRMSCDGKIVVNDNRADVGLIRELNKIGVNLNQMVRKFNATGKAPGVTGLGETLSRINTYLDKVQSL